MSRPIYDRGGKKYSNDLKIFFKIIYKNMLPII